MCETETEKTPLQQKLDEFGNQLSKVNPGEAAVRPARRYFLPTVIIPILS